MYSISTLYNSWELGKQCRVEMKYVQYQGYNTVTKLAWYLQFHNQICNHGVCFEFEFNVVQQHLLIGNIQCHERARVSKHD